MNDTLKRPVTLQQAIVYFSDPDRAFRYAVEFAGRMPDQLPSLRLRLAFVYEHAADLVLQGMQEAVHGQSRDDF